MPIISESTYNQMQSYMIQWSIPNDVFRIGEIIQVYTHSGFQTGEVMEITTDRNAITGISGVSITVSMVGITVTFGSGRVRSWTIHENSNYIPSLNFEHPSVHAPNNMNIEISDVVISEFPSVKKKEPDKNHEENSILDKIL
jgi:hypothetical protein